MGRRTLGSCRCGVCSQPIGIGMPYWIWKKNGDYNRAKFQYVNGTPGPTNGNMEFDYNYGILAQCSSIVHFLEDEVDVLDKANYAGTKGMGTSKLDAIYYGHIPGSLTWDLLNPVPKVYVPTAGTEEFDQLMDYLSLGGVLILGATYELNAVNVDNPQNAPEVAALANDRAKVNAFLGAIGSKASVATVAEESARTGVPVRGMSLMYPRRGAWAFNPDTWVSSGLPLANRVVTYSTDRMYADANRQNGNPSYWGFDDTKTYNITDFTGGANAGVDYLRTYSNRYRNGTGAYYPGMSMYSGIQRRLEGVATSQQGALGNNNLFLRTTDVLGTGLICLPYCNILTRVDGASEVGYVNTAGPLRYLYVRAIAETLPNGGRVLVLGWTPLANIAGSSFSDHYDSNQFLFAMLKKKLQPSCMYLSEGLRGLYD